MNLQKLALHNQQNQCHLCNEWSKKNGQLKQCDVSFLTTCTVWTGFSVTSNTSSWQKPWEAAARGSKEHTRKMNSMRWKQDCYTESSKHFSFSLLQEVLVTFPWGKLVVQEPFTTLYLLREAQTQRATSSLAVCKALLYPCHLLPALPPNHAACKGLEGCCSTEEIFWLYNLTNSQCLLAPHHPDCCTAWSRSRAILVPCILSAILFAAGGQEQSAFRSGNSPAKIKRSEGHSWVARGSGSPC